MLVQRLIEYAGRMEQVPKYYENKPVQWVIEVEPDGSGFGRQFLSLEKRHTKLVPFLARAGTKIMPILLYDKAEYALGCAAEGASESARGKALEKHKSYLDLLALCAEQTKNEDVKAVHRALTKVEHGSLWPPELKPGDWVVFQVDGRFPHEDLAVQKFWAQYRDRDKPASGVNYTCIGCGRSCIPVQRHELPIQIRGGHSKGAKLISANDRAYFSYGLENSLIAPTCAECASNYAKSLIELMSEENSHVIIGDLTYVFWTKHKQPHSIVHLLKSPEPLQVRDLITMQMGNRSGRVQTNDFYAAALSPYISRIVVRDWMETTLERVQEHLVRWFQRQQWACVGEEKYHGTYALAACLYRDARKEMEKNVPLYFLQHALHGKPLPIKLLQQAVRRCKAERKVTAPRATVLYLYLTQNEEDGQKMMEQKQQHPAFLCGRLLAVYEHLQQDAVGANTTLVDRYYGTASTAPASVFGQLARNSQNHLSKLRREPGKVKKHVFFQRAIGEVMGQLETFPKLLNVEEQGLFALGYYQQQQARYRKADKQEESGE